jgi:hypothetical protein
MPTYTVQCFRGGVWDGTTKSHATLMLTIRGLLRKWSVAALCERAGNQASCAPKYGPKASLHKSSMAAPVRLERAD